MTSIGAERYARVHSILDGARKLADADLDGYLASECGADPSMRSEVLELLAIGADDDADDAFADHRIEGVRVELESVVDAATSTWLPDKIGEYTIVRQIGQGGMGVVYEAEQASPRRRVAIKLLHPMHATADRLRRFRHEAALLGRLQHRGIAQIYEAGTYDIGRGPQPFFAMELVDGVDIRTHCEREGLDLAARVELLARVADAVQCAHDHGVIHRDLKPDNVLVTEEGQPRILDFGIARASSHSATLSTIVTEEGQLVGTLAYMAPEQMRQSAFEATTQVDVYALGVLSFELLVGRLPHAIEDLSISEAITLLTSREPPRASALDARLRGDVDTILGKALEVEPGRRYASPAALAGDLRLFLAHRPIQARPPSSIYLVRKFTRRHKALVGGALTTLIVAVIGAVVATSFAITATNRANALERANYISGIAAAASAVDQHDYETAEIYLERTPELHRGWEYEYLNAQLANPADDWKTQARLCSQPVFDASGERMSCAAVDGSIVTWDTSTGDVLDTRSLSALMDEEQRESPPDIALHGATGRFALRVSEREIVIAGPGEVARIPTGARGHPLDWDAEGRRLLYSCDGVFIWEDGRTRKIAPWRSGRGRFSPSGDRVVLSLPVEDSAGAIGSFDSETGEKLAERKLFETVQHLTFSPDGELVALGGTYRNVYLFDARTLELEENLAGHEEAVLSLAWTSDGGRLVSVSDDGMTRVWNRASGWAPTVLPLDAVGHVAVLPDGEHFVVAGERLQRAAFDNSRVLTGHESFVYHIDFSPDGTLLASGGYGEEFLFVWDVHRARLEQKLPAPEVRGGNVWWSTPLTVFSADSKRLFAGTQWETSQWDTETWEPLPVSDQGNPRERFVATVAGTGEVPQRALSPDGRRFATVRGDEVVVYAGQYELSGPLIDSTGTIAAPIFVVGEPVVHGTLKGHFDVVYCAAFSPDGSRIATGSNDKTVRIWDAETCEQLLILRGHDQYVYDVRFSPDGSLLASASGDTTIRLWDTVPPHERKTR